MFGNNKKIMKRTEWVMDDETHEKRDYIESTPYLVPAAETLERYLKAADDGNALIAHDFFYRVDGIIKRREMRLRDYGFRNIIFCRDGDVYVIEGDGLFMKKDFFEERQSVSNTECAVRAEMSYKDRRLFVRSSNGFRDSDPWYALVFLFRMIQLSENGKDTENEKDAENGKDTENEKDTESGKDGAVGVPDSITDQNGAGPGNVRKSSEYESDLTTVFLTDDEETIRSVLVTVTEKVDAVREKEEKEDKEREEKEAEKKKSGRKSFFR